MRKAAGMACALLMCCIFALSGCSRTMDYIIENEPSIRGVVTEVYGSSFIMLGEPTEGYPEPCESNVSLSVENNDSYTSVSVGDEVVVYYNGDIAESYPLRIDTVYAITLRKPADKMQSR